MYKKDNLSNMIDKYVNSKECTYVMVVVIDKSRYNNTYLMLIMQTVNKKE